MAEVNVLSDDPTTSNLLAKKSIGGYDFVNNWKNSKGANDGGDVC